ncbi:MAG TPA: hypothetical protein VHK06_03815 [Candidatus Limnocylindria bacterium]|nr:hypothetical protein [Candidatus Limnocylindria bacterium]
MRNPAAPHGVSDGMPLLLRAGAALAVALGLVAILARPALACSCAAMTPDQALAASDAAFVGAVIEAPPAPGPGAPLVDPPFEETAPFAFEVEGVAKGDVTQPAVVLGSFNGAACGMSFAPGERWLVFATAEGGSLTTNLCAGSIPLAAGERPPVPVESATASASDAGVWVPGPVLVAGGGLALLGAASYLAFRRRPEAQAARRVER